jgi:colanic acid/amylovoran biosynthesis protein
MICGFPALNNYGTGMMGLVTMDQIVKRVGGPVRFLCDFDEATDIDEVRAELGHGPEVATLERHVPTRGTGGLSGKMSRLLGPGDAAGADMAIMLGGDDISEYYRSNIWRILMPMWAWTRHMPVVLLAQTIGPFRLRANRLFARFLFPSFRIVPRDLWTTEYLRQEFALDACLTQGSDLAYADLPLQHRTDIRDEVLARFGLVPDGYATVVISAMQKEGYYTPDRDVYLQRWQEIVEGLLDLPEMAGRKVCLLAHTFSKHYGEERDYIAALVARLPAERMARVVPVTERVLQTRARFILGNGLMTLTGRMHPAVSTFQMGKPAITHAYSAKYEGVIGTMLGRSDLILDANDPALWASGEIVGITLAKASETLRRHAALCGDIAARIAVQKDLVGAAMDVVVRELTARRARRRT